MLGNFKYGGYLKSLMDFYGNKNMQKSMTGFGKTFKMFDKFDILVEIKSVNSKYFDPNFRIPRIISSMEILLRKMLQEKLLRGKVDCRIEINTKVALNKPELNQEMFEKYRSIIDNIRNGAEIEENPKIEHFLRLPDLIEFHSDENVEVALEETVEEAVTECLVFIDSMRRDEGNALEKDLSSRIINLTNILEKIDESKKGVFDYWVAKFKKRMEELDVAGGYEDRIIQEAAIYSEKADITEEITRLKSHFAQFKKIIENEYPAGKKLDFLTQEIHREFNTIASKSSKSDIIEAVVEAKTETDRIREQVQNII